MPDQELNRIVEDFNQFVFSIDDAIEDLAEMANRLGEKDSLDLSMDSLLVLQSVVDKFKRGETGDAVEKWEMINMAAKYLGEVFCKEVGGTWQMEKRKDVAGYGVPGIGKIQGLNSKYIWHPFNVVQHYWERPENGFFLKSIQSIKDIL